MIRGHKSIIILGCIILSACQESAIQITDNDWIATKCEHAPGSSEGILVISGNILSFKDKSLESYFFWNDSLVQYDYQIKEDSIITNHTSLFGEILHLSKDSLLLLVDSGTMITTYIPIKENKEQISKELLDTVLTKKDWLRTYGNGDLRISFWNVEAVGPFVKYCNFLNSNKCQIDNDSGYWSTFKYGDNVFLSIYVSNYYYGSGFYQITQLDTSLIQTYYYSEIETSDSIAFNAAETLDKPVYDSLTAILCSKNWRIEDIQETLLYYDVKEDEQEVDIIPLIRQHEDALLKDVFLRKELNYTFKRDTTYSISNDKHSFSHGKWFLTNDGKYLTLADKHHGSSYTKILEFSADQIVLRQIVKLRESAETNIIVNEDYIVTLF